jgi:hypothetical protein
LTKSSFFELSKTEGDIFKVYFVNRQIHCRRLVDDRLLLAVVEPLNASMDGRISVLLDVRVTITRERRWISSR